MTWEERNGTRRYYRERRKDGRVIRTHFGSGPGAELIARIHNLTRKERLAAERVLLDEQHQIELAEQPLIEFCRLCELAFLTAMLRAGYHFQKNEWRKRKSHEQGKEASETGSGSRGEPFGDARDDAHGNAGTGDTRPDRAAHSRGDRSRDADSRQAGGTSQRRVPAVACTASYAA